MSDDRADSAGVPWAGRRFEPNPAAADDGSAPEQLIEAIRRFGTGEVGETEVVDALRGARLLVPLLAVAGEEGLDSRGRRVDKTQELSIVTVAAPDGRTVQPAFTSVEALTCWNPAARPVPVIAERVALAAAGEQTDLVVLDPTSPTEFVVRRPALWALAQQRLWMPAYADPEVLEAVASGISTEPDVAAVQLAPGDPRARLAGPEVVVHLSLRPGLDRAELDGLLQRAGAAWSAHPVIAERVDSMRIALASAP